MNLEGRLNIDLFCEPHRVRQVIIRSGRPLGAATMFTGKTPAQLLQLLPLVYPLCGTAQSYCAVQACRKALGMAEAGSTPAAQRLLVDLETLREHALRILLDWPGRLGEPAEGAGARSVNAALPRCREALFGSGPSFALDSEAAPSPEGLGAVLAELDGQLASRVFGAAPVDWLGMSGVQDLQEWAARGLTVAARLIREVFESGWARVGSDATDHLPELTDADLIHRLQPDLAAAFCAQPDWQGAPRETTALSRWPDNSLLAKVQATHGKGLLARLTARLVELAALSMKLRPLPASFSFRPPGEGGPEARMRDEPVPMGIGQVEAARGRLLHAVELRQGQIARYYIVAPTEWNFHPQGPAACALAALQPGAQLRPQAEMLIGAIDPCVAYDLRIIDGLDPPAGLAPG